MRIFRNGIGKILCVMIVLLMPLGRSEAQFSQRWIKLWDGLILRVSIDDKGAFKANAADVQRIKKSLIAKLAAEKIPALGREIKTNTLEDAIGKEIDLKAKDGSIYTFYIGLAKNSGPFDFGDKKYGSFLAALRRHIEDTKSDMGKACVGYIVAASPNYELALMKWKDQTSKAAKFAHNERILKEAGQMFQSTLVWEDPFKE